MNNIDRQYKELLDYIIRFGVEKKDRTGTGTKSIFGWQIRHRMEEGFPLLTTKKMAWKQIVTELLWFLRGDTNIKYLVDNGCHIWDGDAYKRYKTTPIDNIDEGHKFKLPSFNGGEILYKPNDYVHYTQQEFINKIKTDDEFAKKWGELGPIYGKQWRSWKIGERKLKWSQLSEEQKLTVSKETLENTHPDVGFFTHENGIDQIANLINDLKTNPDSRRLMVNAWNVGELDQMVLPPCHYGFQLYTRELSFEERWVLSKKCGYRTTDIEIPSIDEKYAGISVRKELESMWNDPVVGTNLPTRSISLMWNQRSVDTFLGLPFNIASYALLLEIIAKEVNMIPEELIGNLGDTHIYLNHIEQAKEQITRTPYELPKLSITNLLCDENWKCYEPQHLNILNYQSHPTIKAPLSN